MELLVSSMWMISSLYLEKIEPIKLKNSRVAITNLDNLDAWWAEMILDILCDLQPYKANYLAFTKDLYH